MKQITAIFFLILFSFNWFGYQLWFDVLQHKTNQNLEILLDNNLYDDAQLLEIKIALRLPYQISQATFERYNGEIEVDGKLYKYAKRKVANDTLFLMCIPNTKKMLLENARNDFFKLSNDLDQNNNSKNSDNSFSIFKNLQPLSNTHTFRVQLIPLSSCSESLWLPLKKENLLSALLLSPERPPDWQNV